VEIDGFSDGEVKCHDLFGFVEYGEENGRIIGELKGSREKLLNRTKLLMAGINWSKYEED